MEVLGFFQWLDSSLLAEVAKAYGGVFAVVQMFHLLALALLGGCVILADLRLMGVLMRDVPSELVAQQTNRWFDVALVVIILSGIFMTGAVAIKLYYNEMFWAKMTALGVGVLFVYGLRRPMFNRFPPEEFSTAVRYGVACASLVVWFTVAASGRWIGFS